MAGLLVFVHHDEGEFAPNSLGMLAKAASLRRCNGVRRRFGR